VPEAAGLQIARVQRKRIEDDAVDTSEQKQEPSKPPVRTDVGLPHSSREETGESNRHPEQWFGKRSSGFERLRHYLSPQSR
jgi:hypothetical protein